ncbi:MAG: flagellar export protein FliJ [Chitinispirillales bacterium]|jgi:flagellar FliJ protein|nr:flagellar export protein FliJ [Chitinispirillales bacterium]
MKRFEFSLQSILELRIREEDEAKAFLVAQESELQRIGSELSQKKKELQDFQAREKEDRKSADSASELRYSVSWRNTLKLDLLKIGQKLQDVSLDIERTRKRLTEATIKRKSLEMLRSKKKLEWQKEFNKNEQKFLDEVAQSRKNNRKNN